MFTVQEEKSRAISIITGTLNPTLTSTDSAFANNQIVVPASTIKEITIKLTNNNNRDAKFNFYYKGDLPTGVNVGYVESTKDIPPDTTGIVLGQGESKEYTIRIKNNSSSSFSLQIGSEGGLSDKDLSFSTDGFIFSLLKGSTGAETLLEKVNREDLVYRTATSEQQKEMWTFSHTAGSQQAGWTEEELTDYRYIGYKPNNYIIFNDETWRIVGVFTVETPKGDGTYVKEKRIKIMRNEFLEPYLTWDGSKTESSYGKNRWSDAFLQKLLNPGYENESVGGSLYYNRQSGTCYGASYEHINIVGITRTCDFTSTGLTATARQQIEDVKWYLGAGTTLSISAENSYQIERGKTVYGKNFFPREYSFDAKVGLLYPSDYGFTYDKEVTAMSGACSQGLSGCWASSAKENGWIYSTSHISTWTITPIEQSPNFAPEDGSNSVAYIHGDGGYYDVDGKVIVEDVYNAHRIRPVVYLKSDVTLTGTGASSDPYQIVS